MAPENLGEQALRRLMKADDLLEPARPDDYGPLPDSLTATRPTFRATYILRDPNNPNDRIVVQIDWREDPEQEGEYEVMAEKFSRLPKGAGEPQRNMDISLLELAE